MYRYLNPEQEASLDFPATVEEKCVLIKHLVNSIVTWRENAAAGSRNACIMVGFYLGRIAALYRACPELVTETRNDVKAINDLVNNIADGDA